MRWKWLSLVVGAVALLAPASVRGQTYPELVSRSATTLTDWDGLRGRISTDARYVVFATLATNLDPTDTNFLIDVYLKDRTTGILTRISKTPTGGPPLGGHSGWNGFGFDQYGLAMSDNGQRIAFLSDATNLVANDTNARRDAFLFDRATGVTTLLSKSAAGTLGNEHTENVAISGDGSFVAFSSYATNLVSGDTNNTIDLFGYTIATGALERVSLTDADAQMPTAPSPDRGAVEPSISRDARYVAFSTEVDLGVTDCVGQCREIWVRDRVAGTTTQANRSSGVAGTSPGSGSAPNISPDGRYVVFQNFSVLAPPDNNTTNGTFTDVYIRDRTLNLTEHISQTTDGRVGHVGCGLPWVSADGRFVGFGCNGLFGADDTLNGNDTYLRDRQLKQTLRISVTSTQQQSTNTSARPVLTPDGRLVLFEGDRLVPEDNPGNGRGDMYLTLNPFLFDPSSRIGSATPTASDKAQMSTDGRYLFFITTSALVGSDTNNAADVYRRDLTDNSVQRVSLGSAGSQIGAGAGAFSISGDGQKIAFIAAAGTIAAKGMEDVPKGAAINVLILRDMISGTTQRVSPSTATVSEPVLSADASRIAFVTPDNGVVGGDNNGMADVYVANVGTPDAPIRVSVPPSGDANGPSRAPAISADGNVVVFESDATNLPTAATPDSNGAADVLRRDVALGTMVRMSNGLSGAANGASQAPQVSADGRVVVFQSLASDLSTGDGNANLDIFVADVSSGTTQRVSSTPTGAAPSGRSSTPRLSADGSTVAFTSAASDVLSGDTNGKDDIFVFERFAGGSKRRVARSDGGTQANGSSALAVLSRDGQKVAFESTATNFSSLDVNGVLSDVFVNGPLDPLRVFRSNFE